MIEPIKAFSPPDPSGLRDLIVGLGTSPVSLRTVVGLCSACGALVAMAYKEDHIALHTPTEEDPA